MRVLAPTEVTSAMLTSSTVPETDHAEWVAGTAYSIGQKVIRLTTHRIYEAITASTGKTPESNPTDWLDLGATNRWRMFDRKVGTASTRTGSMEYVLAPGQLITALAFLELSAESVRVTFTDPVEGVVYNQTRTLTGALEGSGWYSYFFDPVRRRTYAIFDGLPSYRSATITVTIHGLSGETVACGVCLLGSMASFAQAVRYGASAGIIDYSRKTFDDWGNIQVTERAYSKRASWQLLISNSDLDRLQKVLARLRATPALYLGSDLYEATIIYGIYRDFDTTITYPHHSECSIELEGLI